ncbi:MAG: enoyl-CoA hydratase, partial [Sphingomonadales bacterium]
MDNHVLIERPADYEGVLTIRFNRPEKKNAITSSMYHRMTAALADANTDDTIRAVVFLGTEGCFSAGNDMADFLAHAVSGTDEPPAAALFIWALALAQKPMVSGVDGLAIGIGTTLNLHCDLTIASSR